MSSIVPEYPDGLTLPLLTEIISGISFPVGEEAFDIPSFFTSFKALEKIKYVPSVQPLSATEDIDTLCSKYGGQRPYISVQHPYPYCDEMPRIFFFQLCVNDIPEDIRPSSLAANSIIQLFKCGLDDGFCTAYDDKAGTTDPGYLCRIVHPLLETASSEYPEEVEDAYPCKKVTEFIPHLAFPGYDEFCEHFPDKSFEMEWIFAFLEQLDEKFDFLVDGIGGYANWIQNVDFAPCDVCHSDSILVYQIDYQGPLGYEFGDGGNCQILVCPEHGECVKMVWACG
ncbi:DUF1963 domain-containing protein [Aduncisulcus paluster]|uniref:DUF1963 domain-containing protein n=1 Tax=Aduncisulcus paluster TaxID=2918883 RepID=A0ABQ5K805_9EUKA|nr:DUF1963 domain-containing protein [Aduncisulcus paluster]